MEPVSSVKRDDEMGALWKKKSKTGDTFLSGVINLPDGSEQKVLVFVNTRKKNDNHPDYRIIKADPNVRKAEPRAEDDIPF